jgi:Flp pilus assembly protein TadD
MALVTHHRRTAWDQVRGCRGLLGLAACLMVGGCAQLPGGPDALTLSDAPPQSLAQSKTGAPGADAPAPNDLQKATEYWGKQYSQNPRDIKIALNFARNLKAMGEKQRALAVLQQAAIFGGDNRELASEYGRLALDLDQVQLAGRLLAAADDPVNPDWRVISARGTVLAKQGKYAEAIPFYDRALALAHDQPSLLSNLALATAMSGDPARAEQLLRRAETVDGNSPKIRQNLALVLGLQGKYDEAKLIAARDIPMQTATENTTFLRQVVKLEPKAVPSTGDNVDVAEASVAQTKAAAKWAPARVAQAPAAKVPEAKVPEARAEPVAKTEAPAVKAAKAEIAPVAEAAQAPLPWSTDLKQPDAKPAPTPVSMSANMVTHKDVDLSLRPPAKADTDAILPPGKTVDAASVWSANVSAQASTSKAAPKAPVSEQVTHKDVDLSLRAPATAKKKEATAAPGKTAAAQAWSAVASPSEGTSK